MKPIFNGTLTLTCLRNDFVQEYHWPYGFPPHGQQFRWISEASKRRAWQEITDPVADQVGVIFEEISQKIFDEER